MAIEPLVTVITPTAGRPCALRAIESVAKQSYSNVQHLVVIDDPRAAPQLRAKIRKREVDVIELPYPTGQDGYLGFRIYGGAVYIAKGDYVCFLDDDNWYDDDHVASLMEVVRRGHSWAYSLRKIVDEDGRFICNDDCESLGKWPSFLNDNDYLVDTSCYILPKWVAVQSSPIWYRRTRQPGFMEPDRALTMFLRSQNLTCETTARYSLNYRTGSRGFSVRKEFFLHGNQEMLKRYNGNLPWKNLRGAREFAATPQVNVAWRLS